MSIYQATFQRFKDYMSRNPGLTVRAYAKAMDTGTYQIESWLETIRLDEEADRKEKETAAAKRARARRKHSKANETGRKLAQKEPVDHPKQTGKKRKVKR